MTPQKYLANNNGGIDFSVLNTEGNPEIFTGEPPVPLKVKLTNLTGNAIGLSSACTLRIFMPDFFTATEVSKITIAFKDWTFSYDSDGNSLVLKYSGPAGGTWIYGDTFAFDLVNVATNSVTDSGSAQVNFENFGAGVPGQQTSPLTVTKKPIKGNADLTKVLQVSLDNQGQIFVSPTGDPIRNMLFLNIKNIGADPLYNSQVAWTVAPTISIVFVYGSSSGSLAPDDKATKTKEGSAWNIIAGVSIKPDNFDWNTENPKDKPTLDHPKWILKPAQTNQSILGTGINSNIIFSFNPVISFTPPGHTQMVITFSGFMKDDKTPYDPAVYVLDIVKQNAPPTRGLVNFFSPTPIITVAEPNVPINVPLRWAMFEVPRVDIITSYEGMSVYRKLYKDRPIVDYDNTIIKIPGVTQSSAVIITAQAYNNNNAYLNSIQFTVFIQATMFVDPRDGKKYPVVRINNRLWMAANLDYVTPDSMVNGPEDEFGRLYTFQDALPTGVHGGWRLPNKDDWNDLIASGSYDDLVKGGKSGFSAVLNGWRDNNGHDGDFGSFGHYWTSNHQSGGVDYVNFSSGSKSVFIVGPPDSLSPDYYLSVRYVKDIS